MSNVIEFRLPPGRRSRKDKRIKIGLNHEQLAILDAEAARRRCSRSAIVGSYLADLIEHQRQARR